MDEKTLAKMIEAVNRHMPEKTRTLAEMLKEKDPTIRARDGNEYYIEKRELEFIAKHVDELDWPRFRIPVILEMNDIGGERVIYVRDKLHAEFIKRLSASTEFSTEYLRFTCTNCPKSGRSSERQVRSFSESL